MHKIIINSSNKRGNNNINNKKRIEMTKVKGTQEGT